MMDAKTNPGQTPAREDCWTVEEASCWLTEDARPLPLALLRTLGKDCSMVSRIMSSGWWDKPVIGRNWPTERAYTRPVLLEVFSKNPATAELMRARGLLS